MRREVARAVCRVWGRRVAHPGIGSVAHIGGPGLGLALALASLVAPAAATAQVVEGRLLDSDTRRPIPGGVVTLMDTASAVAAASTTDDEGRFLLRAPEPGRYWVIGRAVGYWPKHDGVIDLHADGWMPVDFYLRPAPLELPGLTARARGEGVVVDRFMRRDKEYLEWQGFYEREEAGFGSFITPEELKRRKPLDVPSLIRGIPGISADGPYLKCGNRPSTPGNHPVLYVDGIRQVFPPLGERNLGGEGPVELEAAAPIPDIVGVEVYTRASQYPLQYGGTLDSRCLILVWTKH